MSNTRHSVAAAVLCLMLPAGAMAQNTGTPGASWSGTWGFASTAERTLLIQQAEAMRTKGPTTVTNTYNTYNTDSRQNYQEIVGTGGLGNVDFQLNGDRIGQNTNTIGAMNTGTTNIEITGDRNVVDATNAADSAGCLDGSIQMTETGIRPGDSPSGIDISVQNPLTDTTCALR